MTIDNEVVLKIAMVVHRSFKMHYENERQIIFELGNASFMQGQPVKSYTQHDDVNKILSSNKKHIKCLICVMDFHLI